MKNIMNNMKTKYFVMLVLTSLLTTGAVAQEKKELTPGEKILAEADPKNPFEKKLRLGVSWNQYWGIIKGKDLPKQYFAKPCLGFNLRAEYYPLSFIGIGVGFGMQMRGAGIINEDKTGSTFTHPWNGVAGDNTEDSTYRERLRFNTWELPITLLLRTPKDIVKGVRLTGALGVVLIKNNYVHDFWNRPEDGFHTETSVSKDYIKSDLGYQASLGTDIDAGACVLQVHLVYSRGTKNIYKNDAGNGTVETFGFRVAWLY